MMLLSDHDEHDGSGKLRPLAEINVTPMVDVMLVLLIIFMVAAPLLASGVKVDLPKSSSAPTLAPEKPVIVNVMKDGSLLVNKAETPRTLLVQTVHAALDGDSARPVYVQGDQSAAYSNIIGIIDALAQGGMQRVVLVVDRKATADATDPTKEQP
jgi:biopolymer transport protein TolR